MEQLPKEKASVYEPVFWYAGMYYFSLVLAKQNKRKRFTSGHNKCYRAVVLTCLTTSATNLESAEELIMDVFILDLK